VRLARAALSLAVLAVLEACSALPSSGTAPLSLYALDTPRDAAPPAAPTKAPGAQATLVVSPPHAAAGYDSKHIVYVRQAHRLENYAHNEWVDTPARMLAPLIVSTLAQSGRFRAVVLTPSSAAGDLRLDSEIIRLQLDSMVVPSHVRFTLRANLVDSETRRVLAWREFDASIAVTSEDPYASVVAANRAVQDVLKELSAFCDDVAARRPPRHDERE
jgi:cholesterol transport system auxiliary component